MTYKEQKGNVNLNVTVNNYYNQRNNKFDTGSSLTATLMAAASLFGRTGYPMGLFSDPNELLEIEEDKIRNVTPKDDNCEIRQISDGDGGSIVSLKSTNVDVRNGVVDCHFDEFEASFEAFAHVLKIFLKEISIEGYNLRSIHTYNGYTENHTILYKPLLNNAIFINIKNKIGNKFKLSKNKAKSLDMLIPNKHYYLIIKDNSDVYVFRVDSIRDKEFLYFDLVC